MKINKNITTKPFRFLLSHVRHKPVLAIGAFLAAIIAQSLGAIEPYLVKQFIDQATQSQSESVVFWGSAIALTFFVAELVWRLSGFIGMRLAMFIQTSIYRQLFSYLLEHSVGYFHNRFAGNLASKLSYASNSANEIVCSLLWNYVPLGLQILISLGLTFTVHPWFAWGLLGWIGLFLWLNWRLMHRKEELSKEYASTESALKGATVDTVSNIDSVSQFSRISFEKTRLSHLIQRVYTVGIRGWSYGEWVLALNGVLQAVLMAGLLWGGVTGWQQGWVSIGELTMLLMLTIRITRELLFIGHQLNNFMKNIGQLREGLEIIGESHDLLDPENPEICHIKAGKIEFKDLTFGYSDGNKPVFQALNLTIQPGEKIGFVGRSGGGKTTITKLILRLMDPQRGVIEIDGQNIASIKQSDLREQIAYVPQEPILFHRSLAENIGYGDLDADQSALIEASKKAHAHEFIVDLAQGYDTLVGERGVKLSGGQKQRIAIARAILKPSPILILDEATSALDSESENLIQAALDNAMSNRTTIVIAHRLSTVQKMDRIIVLEKGKIIEMGSHEKLLQKNGAYAELWSHQYGEFLG